MTTTPAQGAAATPALSIVITTVSGPAHLQNCLRALHAQQDTDPAGLDILVPHDARDGQYRELARDYPNVRFLPVSLTVDGPAGLCHEHFDQLRATGLAHTGGAIVAMLEDHETPDPGWCRQLLETHRQLPHAAVGGAVECGSDRALNLATWFLDFGRYQNPLPRGPSPFLTDVNIAYKRNVLERIRTVWEHGYSEPDVHARLLADGETLWMTPEMVVYQQRDGLTLARVMRERFVWGRFFAGNRVRGRTVSVRMLYSVATLAVPGIILLKKTRDVLRKRRLRLAFLRALPYLVLLTLGWSAGELTGYLSGRPSSYGGDLSGRPG